MTEARAFIRASRKSSRGVVAECNLKADLLLSSSSKTSKHPVAVGIRFSHDFVEFITYSLM